MEFTRLSSCNPDFAFSPSPISCSPKPPTTALVTLGFYVSLAFIIVSDVIMHSIVEKVKGETLLTQSNVFTFPIQENYKSDIKVGGAKKQE